MLISTEMIEFIHSLVIKSCRTQGFNPLEDLWGMKSRRDMEVRYSKALESIQDQCIWDAKEAEERYKEDSLHAGRLAEFELKREGEENGSITNHNN